VGQTNDTMIRETQTFAMISLTEKALSDDSSVPSVNGFRICIRLAKYCIFVLYAHVELLWLMPAPLPKPPYRD